MRISKNQVANIFGFIVIIFSILLSKTVYFGVIHRENYQYVYFATVIFMLLFCGISLKKLKKGIIIVLPLILLMLLNLVFNVSDMSGSNVNLLIGNCVFIFIAMLIAVCIDKRKFSAWYIRLMAVMCAISIPCWLVASISPELAMAFCQPGYDWTVRYGYSPFYTWGWNGVIFSRNSGMFWEPGAFQGFIFLAMLMLLFKTENDLIKNKKILFFLFVVTMLTTKSTTGYLLTAALIICCWKKIRNLFGVNKNYFQLAVTVLLGLGVFYIILNSGNIAEKFSGATSDSTITRFSDITGGLAMSVKGGLIGLGETATRDQYKLLLGVNQDDSVGLLAMIYTYGILFGTYYIGLMCSGIQKFFNSSLWEYAFLLICFIILHMTEGLWFLPIYLILMFSGILWEDKPVNQNFFGRKRRVSNSKIRESSI